LYGSEILSKNWDIWNIKFQQNSIVYYFFFIFLAFLAFCFRFHLSKLVQKLWKFFVVFYWKGLRSYQRFLENSNSSFKKNIDMWNIFFWKFYRSLFVFYFLLFLTFIFNFAYLYLSTNSRNFYVFLFYVLEILWKNFGKSWNTFLKNIYIWNPKFLINSIVFYFFLSILVIFFSYFTCPNLSKNSKHFCAALLYGL